jgi:hypothetical protein
LQTDGAQIQVDMSKSLSGNEFSRSSLSIAVAVLRQAVGNIEVATKNTKPLIQRRFQPSPPVNLQRE